MRKVSLMLSEKWGTYTRKQALSMCGMVAIGKDPIAEKRRERLYMQTFGEHFHEYLERYSKLHKKSWRYDEREVNKFLSKWFNRRLIDIRKSDVQMLHEKTFKENGLYQANRILERVRGIFNKAIEWGWEGTNPAVGIKKYKEKSRDRFIQPDEMPCITQALEEETNETVKDYFWILLLTGARKTNTMMMRWEQISWELGQWRIPDTKNGDPLNVPLVDRAIEILKRRRDHSESEWVFPQDENPKKHLINCKRAWLRTLERATLHLWRQNKKLAPWLEDAKQSIPYYLMGETGFKMIVAKAEKEKVALPSHSLLDIRVHDIRRTFGSYQALTGASLQVIGRSLGHKSTQATQVYARLNLDAVRASVEKATDAMFK